jgi:hypothetical protein
MALSRRSISLLLLLNALAVSGCHTTHAKSAPSQPPPAAAQPPAPPAAKHPPRDSALSVYHNPARGISFRYPRTYLLDESSDSENSAISEAEQQLTTDQPGATLVALVSIPPDAYPNTTFAGGTLQFAVNPALTSAACHALAAPTDDALNFGSSSVSGLTLAWVQRSSTAMGTGYLNRDYAGFANNSCYEFLLQVSTRSNPDDDPLIKPADAPKILHQLAKIVSSVQIRPVPANPPSSQSLPVVHSFTVAPLSHRNLAGVYRASWRIAGSSRNEVFISVACSPAVGVYHLSDPVLTKAGFPCGIFTPAAPQAGSLDFQLDNHAPREVPVTVTLFLPTLGYGTRTVLVPSHSPLSD